MQWLALTVLALALAWWLLRHRTPPPLPPKPKVDPRRRLAAQLIEAAKVARGRGQAREAQLLALKATWLLLEPPLGRDDPPVDFNPNHRRHLALVDEIRVRFGEFLATIEHSPDGPRDQSEALLPYPKPLIVRALHLVLDLAEGRVKSVHVEPGTLSQDMVSTVKASLELLSTFGGDTPGQ